MSEKKYVVPDGMLKAADEALSVEQEQFRLWLKGSTSVPCPGENGYPLLLMLRAALRWLSENPIVPTDEQINSMVDKGSDLHWGWDSYWREHTRDWLIEWQRRMFAAPDPEVTEEIEQAAWEVLVSRGVAVNDKLFGIDREGVLKIAKAVLDAYRRKESQ